MNTAAAAPRRSPVARLRRVLRHLLADPADGPRRLGPGATERLTARVAASEARHTGQIRVSVEAGLPLSYLWRDAPPRQRALMVFSKLRVWNTEANNGVLIHLLLADRAIELVADRGLARHVDAAQWQAIVDVLQSDCRAGRFEAGLAAAIDAVDALLRRHFPRGDGQGGDGHGGGDARNELPDAPTFG
jgi:uncharacterized membrane protein YgcG